MPKEIRDLSGTLNYKGDIRPYMTLKQESKVKFDTCKRFADHDFQQVVFSSQTPRTNDKEDVGAF